jgi:hypothetical protein
MGVQERVAELQYSENSKENSSTILIEDIYIDDKTLKIDIIDGEEFRTVSFGCRWIAKSNLKSRLSDKDVDYDQLSTEDKRKIDEVEQALKQQFETRFVGNDKWTVTRTGTGDELSLVVQFNTELIDDIHIADVVDKNGNYVGEELEDEILDDESSVEQISEAVRQLDFGGKQLYIEFLNMPHTLCTAETLSFTDWINWGRLSSVLFVIVCMIPMLVTFMSGYNIVLLMFSNLLFTVAFIPFLFPHTQVSEVFLLTTKYENNSDILVFAESIFWFLVCPVVPFLKTPFKKYGSELEASKLSNE